MREDFLAKTNTHCNRTSPTITLVVYTCFVNTKNVSIFIA